MRVAVSTVLVSVLSWLTAWDELGDSVGWPRLPVEPEDRLSGRRRSPPPLVALAAGGGRTKLIDNDSKQKKPPNHKVQWCFLLMQVSAGPQSLCKLDQVQTPNRFNLNLGGIPWQVGQRCYININDLGRLGDGPRLNGVAHGFSLGIL